MLGLRSPPVRRGIEPPDQNGDIGVLEVIMQSSSISQLVGKIRSENSNRSASSAPTSVARRPVSVKLVAAFPQHALYRGLLGADANLNKLPIRPRLTNCPNGLRRPTKSPTKRTWPITRTDF